VRPSTVALAYAAVAGAAALAGFGADLPWGLTLAVSVACVLVGLGRAGLMLLGLAQRRRIADRLLRTGVKVHPQSELLTWPLYVGGRAEDVSKSIERCLAARDGDGVAARSSERAIADFTSRSGGRARVHIGGGLR
jgi:hypothetical protein